MASFSLDHHILMLVTPLYPHACYILRLRVYFSNMWVSTWPFAHMLRHYLMTWNYGTHFHALWRCFIGLSLSYSPSLTTRATHNFHLEWVDLF